MPLMPKRVKDNHRKMHRGNRGGNATSGDYVAFGVYGDMDTEERMKKFLDYVTEYLDWDNNTAGRNMEVR